MTAKCRFWTFSRLWSQRNYIDLITEWPSIVRYARWQTTSLGGRGSTKEEGSFIEYGYCEFNTQVRIVAIKAVANLRDFHWIPWEGERNDARHDLPRPAGSAGEGRLDVGLISPPQEYGVWLPPRRMRKNFNKALVKDHSPTFDGSKVEDTSQVCYYDDSQNEFSDVLDEASNQEFLEEEWDSISEFSDHIPHGKDAYTEQLRPCRQPFVSKQSLDWANMTRFTNITAIFMILLNSLHLTVKALITMEFDISHPQCHGNLLNGLRFGLAHCFFLMSEYNRNT